ncbi:hypothetical protein [Rhizobium leguminosarum]|uniref:hypothetical protein n=1 Tax=Rhizobium leguminosarum TaxID=384 RepID=UPI001FDF1D11|nr:hypothetical protein [Rhizobium leguminosarum]
MRTSTCHSVTLAAGSAIMASTLAIWRARVASSVAAIFARMTALSLPTRFSTATGLRPRARASAVESPLYGLSPEKMDVNPFRVNCALQSQLGAPELRKHPMIGMGIQLSGAAVPPRSWKRRPSGMVIVVVIRLTGRLFSNSFVSS